MVDKYKRIANETTNSAPSTRMVDMGDNTWSESVYVTTVSSVTSDQIAIPGTIADQASAAITTTTTSAVVTPTFGSEYEVNQIVTAVSGTTPTLDLVVQESDDSGTNFYDVYHFPRITAAGAYRSPKLVLKGNRIRYVETLTGTTPSFTRSRNRLQGSSAVGAPIRRIFDRAIVLTTLSATTAAVNVQDCRNLQLSISLGAATTPPALQLQGSDDNGATWTLIGSPLTGVTNATVSATVNNINYELVRAIVTTIGVTVTSNFIAIKGF
jgi:hypothetical protein